MLMCSPTPRVSWRRLDAPMPRKNYNSSFGQELVIPDVDFSDKGKYECVASNSMSGPGSRREFTLIVECKSNFLDCLCSTGEVMSVNIFINLVKTRTFLPLTFQSLSEAFAKRNFLVVLQVLLMKVASISL